jgi:hypothetical protein
VVVFDRSHGTIKDPMCSCGPRCPPVWVSSKVEPWYGGSPSRWRKRWASPLPTRRACSLSSSPSRLLDRRGSSPLSAYALAAHPHAGAVGGH